MKTRLLMLSAALALGSQAHAGHGNPDALTGAILGAVAGGIIGNNVGDGNTWRGAAIGAGAGYILGSSLPSSRGHVTYTEVRDHGYDRRSDHDRSWDRSYDRSWEHDRRRDWDRRSPRCDTDVIVIQPHPLPRPVHRPRETTIIRTDDCGSRVIVIEERRGRRYDDATIIIRR